MLEAGVVLLWLAIATWAEEPSFDEVLLAIDSSELDYEIVPPTGAHPALQPALWLHEGRLEPQPLPEEAAELADRGGKAFGAGDPREAMRLYREARALAPDYPHLDVLIADCHFTLGELDAARAGFEAALALNPHDYDAHWFLADTLLRQGELDAGLVALLRAHVLNRNHAALEERVHAWRAEDTDDRVRRKQPVPTYAQVFREGDTVRIEVDGSPSSLAYGLWTAALYHEPPLASRIGAPGAQPFDLRVAEYAAGQAAVQLRGRAKRVRRCAIKHEAVRELLWYDIILPNDPHAAFLLSTEDIDRIGAFVRTCH